MQNLITSDPLDNITRIEYHGQLVLTTAQLAEALSSKGDRVVTANNLKLNFRNNADRFIEGKHYFKLEGDDLDILRGKNFNLQISPKTRTLYLWTRQGCARHCKSVGTDVAWDVFELLEDAYFNQDVDRDKPLTSITEFKVAVALTKLAAHAEDPYMKKRLVAEAANRLLGEKVFTVPDCQVQMQLTLFK